MCDDKKVMPDVFVTSLMSLYEGSTIRVRVDSMWSKSFEVDVATYQGSV